MYGMLITGHGTFASGIISAVELLYGKSTYIAAVDFAPHESEEILMEHQRQALVDLEVYCSRIVILCDILGGSPFKAACTLAHNRGGCQVLYGINLPITLELSMRLSQEDTESDMDELVGTLLQMGRSYMGSVPGLGKA